MALSSKAYVFDPRPVFPLLITARRYWKSGSKYLNDPSALTLIFAHGTGFHKEHWEPTIDELYALLDSEGNGHPKVMEVWSIDAPNHGDAAVLNEYTLKLGYEPIFPWEEYTRALHSFLTNFGTGVDVDFSTRRLVGIGHSMGAVCLLLSLGYSSKLKYQSLILCELMSMHPTFMENPNPIPVEGANPILIEGAKNRRDVWPSFEDAYKILKNRPNWKVWDDRVLKMYVKHGMRSLPTAVYPDKTDGVTLKCTRNQEAACLRDPYTLTRSYYLLGALARQLPIHLIYGSINDQSSQAVKDDLINNAVGGVQHLASLSRVEGVGHLVVQVNPAGLAKKIYDALALPLPPQPKL